MLYYLPIMLFLYAQSSTDYALKYASNLPIMLKLCSLFLEGANVYVQIIELLCYVQHRNFITNLKPGSSRSYHVKTLSLGAEPRHEDEILGAQLVTRHSLRARLPVDLKNYLLFPHNAQCFLVPIIPQIMPA